MQDIASNPEFSQKAMAARQSSLVASQLFMLKTAVGHLRNAQNGLDVEWTDVGKLDRSEYLSAAIQSLEIFLTNEK